ncbi:NfeD family protein, partial [Chloroflexota bacterium]
MRARRIFAIISTLLEEVALVAVVLWGLPKIGINMPLPGLAVLMVLWLTYSIVTYQITSRALARKPLINYPDMVGARGMVISPFAPEGLVKIKGEIWVAKSVSKGISIGSAVVVVEQERLKLVVE